MSGSPLFSDADARRISEAVRAAEQSTSGEIVPYVVKRSDAYPEAIWRAGALGVFAALFAFAVADLVSSRWLPFSISEIALIAAGCFGLAAGAVAAIPRTRMWLIPNAIEQQRVDERAALAFLSEEVFRTRERTGILILVSLLEHRVSVLGDAGINARVEKKEWDDVVKLVVDGMKRGTPADGLVSAIARCGSILEQHGVEIRPDDTNELGDGLRMSDR